MRPLEEILKSPYLSIGNDVAQVLLAKGAAIALDGTFTDPVTRKTWVFVFSDDPYFEHLSISSRHKTPDWDTMSRIKDVFFQDEEECVQFHPKKSQYVNIMEHCLHIWRFKGELPKEWELR